jgi:hypothetical protein
MKTLRLNRMLLLGFLVTVTGSIATAQSTLESEVPGDHFSLEGALELFKKSASPEEFEKRLNSPDSKVNNLDLNNDNYTDYIRVIDRSDRNVHAFILQAVLSENESQDVAVIELEKLHNGKAVLQITGDADVYGIETIIEPTEEVKTYAGATTTRTIVNVWTWPSVQYVYSPYYSVWVSPWQWAYQPVWWSPWRPVAYYVYDPWWSPYRSYYSSCHTHRVYYAREIYRPYRTSSVIVVNNYGPQINHYRSRNGNNRHDRDQYGSNGYNNSDGGYRNNSRSNSRNNDYSRNGNDNEYQSRGNNNSGRPDEGNVNSEHNQYRSTDRSKPNNQHAEIAKSQSLNERKFNDRSAPAFDRTPEQKQLSYSNSGSMRKVTRSSEDQIKPQRQSNSSFSKPEQRQSSFNRPQREQTRSSFTKPQQQRSSTPSQSFSKPQQQRSSTPSQSFSRPQQQRSSTPSQSFSKPQQQRSSAPSQSSKGSSHKPSDVRRGR